MKLNAQILFENLNESFPAELSGYHTSELNLRRPEFFLDPSGTMQAGHLYLLTGEQFPRRLKLEKGCVILCTGNVPLARQYLDRCALIRLREKADAFTLMNAVTAVFDKYSFWYEQLHQIVETTADLQEMTELTSRLFRNPVMVLDSELRYVATAGYDQDERKSIAFEEGGADKLSINALNQFLSVTDMKTDETDPMHLEILGNSVLSYNLFDLNEYAGSLTLEYRSGDYRPGDEPIIRLFAHYLMLAMKQHTRYMSSGHSILRQTFQSLLEDMPVDPEDRLRLEHMDLPAQWRCIVLQPSERLSKVPASYVCEQVEALYPGSIAFSHETGIVLFLSSDLLDNSAEARREFIRLLEEQFDSTGVRVGISSPFADLFTARWYYTQGRIALENGSIFDPEETFCFFEHYALEELIINAPGDQPLEMYFPEGLTRLFEHDARSATSYIETLDTFLRNNLNVTATAEALYIHRSTLLERLSRIRKELREDLKDPDVQLRLRILLKALELRQKAFA
ncbi:MAG: helix-turn-helix domain-containing protein [Clostridia bacterium]|nr:helix-turn-helix domain-containing protein [Clostridia bacterium]MBR5753115.1 helix-turn-helix domain-containing protein [Clostridia bacterium]